MEEMDMPHRIEDHELRITQLEQNYGKVIEKIDSMERGQVEIQNVVLKEFSTTKDMLTAQNQTNAKLLEQMYGIKTLKITTRKDIFIGLLGGSGIVGILSLVISQWDKIIKMFGG
ncbi:hypothetical protein [Bacillus sp. T33-2]|uniref:hypothetical protein n=1 Tax=Bacillus sp. T33-2 TaxID=2054168 RepID=UPI000C781B77|nr:hypothetical protein [Bacillus sp. T33-2]PLR93183.1 hypothetical protein CVD19_19440 [Bacillus sp. T33-2]